MSIAAAPFLTMSVGGSTLEIQENGALSFLARGADEWKSSGPLFLLHYYDRQHPRAQVVAAPSFDGYVFGTAGTPSLSSRGVLSKREISKNETLITTTFTGIDIEIALRLTVNPDGSGFSIRIDDAGIKEERLQLYRILNIEVLPEFGAAKTGESGYLTLPNWSGCQTFFNKSYPREVRETIYSSNDQWEHVCNMPVFGITRAQGTMCGLVAQGDFDAQLVCRVHWEEQQANSVHPTLVYRWQQQDERLAGPREVRYAFAPADYKDGEGYVFCGKICREFYRTERGLLTWEEKAKTRPVVLDYRDRFFLKIFMAYKDPQADGKGAYHSTCTFVEAREILEQCLARGMKKIQAILVGWGQDGHDGMPPTRFPVDERLGGEKEMKNLIAWCKEKDIMLGVHDSYGAAYTCSPEFNTEDLIRHRTGEYWESIIWSGGQAHLICPSIWVDKHVKRDVPAVRALGIYGHHHIDAVGSFVTCYSKEHPLSDRQDYANQVRKMFQFTADTIGSVSTEMPFGPYFNVVDGFFHSFSHPYNFHYASAPGRFFLDKSIPLLSIVVHGSINAGEAGLSGSLHWLDWGLTLQSEVCRRPSPTFGIPTYEQMADMLATNYERYYGAENLVPRLAALSIDARWDLAEGVSETRYSDGTVVRVNTTANAFKDLAANSYQIAWGKKS